MNKKQITQELHKRLDSLFKDFMSAEKRYFEQPSINNGSRRQEARENLNKAIKDFAEYAFETWHLTPDESNKLVDEIMEYK